jgi:hypothetical protein
MVYLSMQDQMNTESLLLLDNVPCNDTSVQTISVIHFRKCVIRSRTNTVVNALTASSCYITMLVPMQLKEFRRN